jgi:hypothetical protein
MHSKMTMAATLELPGNIAAVMHQSAVFKQSENAICLVCHGLSSGADLVLPV